MEKNIQPAKNSEAEIYESPELTTWKFDSIKLAMENEGQTIATRLNNIRFILSQEQIPDPSGQTLEAA